MISYLFHRTHHHHQVKEKYHDIVFNHHHQMKEKYHDIVFNHHHQVKEKYHIVNHLERCSLVIVGVLLLNIQRNTSKKLAGLIG